jgi:hypothetical protein
MMNVVSAVKARTQFGQLRRRVTTLPSILVVLHGFDGLNTQGSGGITPRKPRRIH